MEKLPLAAHLDRAVAAPKPPPRIVQGGNSLAAALFWASTLRLPSLAEKALQLAQFCMLPLSCLNALLAPCGSFPFSDLRSSFYVFVRALPDIGTSVGVTTTKLSDSALLRNAGSRADKFDFLVKSPYASELLLSLVPLCM